MEHLIASMTEAGVPGDRPHRPRGAARPLHRLRTRPRALAARAAPGPRLRPDVGADPARGRQGDAERPAVRARRRQLHAARRPRRLPALHADHAGDGRRRSTRGCAGWCRPRSPRAAPPSSGRGSSRSSRRCSTTCPATPRTAGRPAARTSPAAADGGDLRAGRHPRRGPPRWREYGAAVAAGHGAGVRRGHPGDHRGRQGGGRAAAAAEPGDDLIADLVRSPAEDGDRLSDAELVTLVWHLVLAGQTPTNLIANAVAALLPHPDQLAALRADPGLMPGAVEELTRWCGPQLLTHPPPRARGRRAGRRADPQGRARHRRDRRGQPRPARVRRPRPARPRAAPPTAGHLGFAHGPHFCLGASLARVQTEVALTALLRRFPRSPWRSTARPGSPTRPPGACRPCAVRLR